MSEWSSAMSGGLRGIIGAAVLLGASPARIRERPIG